jgi:hypothetical protein
MVQFYYSALCSERNKNFHVKSVLGHGIIYFMCTANLPSMALVPDFFSISAMPASLDDDAIENFLFVREKLVGFTSFL